MNNTMVEGIQQWSLPVILTWVTSILTLIMQVFQSLHEGHFESKCCGHRLTELSLSSEKEEKEKVEIPKCCVDHLTKLSIEKKKEKEVEIPTDI